MGSFIDRMKEKLHAAGEGAKRLGEVANLKLELGDARKDLERKYRKLGEHTAAGLIDGEAGRIFQDMDPWIQRMAAAAEAMGDMSDKDESMSEEAAS